MKKPFSLSDLLLLESVQSGISRIRNTGVLHTKIQIDGFDDKILLTRHDMSGFKPTSGKFKIEKLTGEVFAILPQSLNILKN